MTIMSTTEKADITRMTSAFSMEMREKAQEKGCPSDIAELLALEHTLAFITLSLQNKKDVYIIHYSYAFVNAFGYYIF